MAKPRVFISSTFYDLKQIRSVLETFVRQMGFDPILNERGNIPYGSEERPEKYAYREVEQCDIFVSVIGGRFGTESFDKPYSISQKELQTAADLGKQIYIFIETGVHAEYQTFLLNKSVEGVRFRHADPRIYKFIEEVEAFPKNNAIAPFEMADDIVEYLREQWAGLFHRFLQEEAKKDERRTIDEIKGTARTLRELVDYLSKENKHANTTVESIILHSHPLFKRVQESLKLSHPVIFRDLKELDGLMTAYGYEQEYDPFEEHVEICWLHSKSKTEKYFSLPKSLFNDAGRLVLTDNAEWDDSCIVVGHRRRPAPTAEEYDPFKDE